jgi:plasmid stabilization system protein ParE
MKKREVLITTRAERELREASRWYIERAPAAVAAKWFDGALKAILSLSKNPERCGLAHESDEFPFELRELLYGSGRKKTHRILFAVRPDKVVVHGIRHMSQRDLTPDDL